MADPLLRRRFVIGAHRVTTYRVDQHAVKLQIPEDQEVILVSRDFGSCRMGYTKER